MGVFNKRFIFVSFEQGGGGHRVGRVLTTLPSIHWYSDPRNGIHPWNTFSSNPVIAGRSVAPAHFDRITKAGVLPPTWDYVKDFVPDQDQYWLLFESEFIKSGGNDIDKTLLYCTHMLPEDIITRFPNSLVISIHHPVETIVNRYMKTTALFPGYIKALWLDGPNTPHGELLKKIADLDQSFTVRDIWSYHEYNRLYTSDMDKMYRQHLYHKMKIKCDDRRKFTHPQQHILTNWPEVKDFFNDHQL